MTTEPLASQPGDSTDPVTTDPVTADPVTTAALRAIDEAVDILVDRGAWPLTDDALAGLVQASEIAARRLLAVQVRAAAEAGRRGLPQRVGCKGTGVWLRSLVNLTVGEAGQRARAGELVFTSPRGLDQPEVRAALLDGSVTVGHAHVVAGAVAELMPPTTPAGIVDDDTRAEVQVFLAERARVLDARQLRTLATTLTARLDSAAGGRLARDEDRQHEQRALTFVRDGTGLTYLTGTLTATCAGLLQVAIDAAAAPQPGADGSADPRSAAMRRHDGLQHVLGQVVAADGVLPSTHSSPYRLVVQVQAETLAARVGAGAGLDVARLADGWPLSPLTVQTMACTADLVPVLVSSGGDPLDVGDTQYPFPARIRTAIATRDQGCTYPGCGAPPAWCDAHHLVRFASGGRTSAANGALLCGRHHRYVHALGIAGELVAGAVVWHPPSRAQPGAATAGADPPGRVAAARAVDGLVQRWLQRNPHLRQ